MQNMDAFDLLNINMKMHSSCKQKKYCKGFSQEEDFVAEKFSRQIIRNSLKEDHYGQNKLLFDEMISVLYQINTPSLMFIVLTH